MLIRYAVCFFTKRLPIRDFRTRKNKLSGDICRFCVQHNQVEKLTATTVIGLPQFSFAVDGNSKRREQNRVTWILKGTIADECLFNWRDEERSHRILSHASFSALKTNIFHVNLRHKRMFESKFLNITKFSQHWRYLLKIYIGTIMKCACEKWYKLKNNGKVSH